MTPETLITDHIDTWTSTIKAKSSAGRGGGKKQEFYGIKKLRELILELAVRGLLVPQDPEDEPASEFLKKIAAEKSKLVKTGKIKKQKNLPPLSKDELDFETPDGWKWIRLQDVAEYIQRGKGPKYADNGSVRVVSQKCVQWTGFDLSAARFVSDESLAKYQPERFLRSNDLLWNSTGTGTAGRINRINDIPENALVADSHVTIVRVLNFNSSFINCYISSSSIQNRLLPTHENSLVSGTTNQVELNTSSAINLPVPLPPLAEQQRIVAKVDELMALCDQLEQQQEDSVRTRGALVETLLGALTAASERGDFAEAWQRIASHFDTLFTTEASIAQLKQTILQLAVMGKLVEQDPDVKPRKELTVGDHVEFQNGYAFKSGSFKDSGVLLCRNMNVSHGILDWSESKFVDEKVAVEFERFALNEGDIVLSLDRPLITTGLKVARVRKKDLPCLLLQRVAKPVPKHRKIDLSYFYMWLHSPAFVESIDPGRSNGVPHISTKQVQSLPFVLPPLAEQHRIVAKVDELMALCDRLKANLQSAQETQVLIADCLVKTTLEIHS